MGETKTIDMESKEENKQHSGSVLVSSDCSLPWVGLKYAREWPEGSKVLIRRKDRTTNDYRGLEICCHFRPDWLSGERGYSPPSPNEMEFLLIEAENLEVSHE